MYLWSKVKDADKVLSRGPWKWYGGSEQLPELGEKKPARGLGAFVDTRLCSGAEFAEVVREGQVFFVVKGARQGRGLVCVFHPLPCVSLA